MLQSMMDIDGTKSKIILRVNWLVPVLMKKAAHTMRPDKAESGYLGDSPGIQKNMIPPPPVLLTNNLLGLPAIIFSH